MRCLDYVFIKCKLVAIFTLFLLETLQVASSCPSICSCHAKSIDCSGKSLTYFETANLPVNTEILILDDNKLETLPGLAHLQNLQTLSLSRNSILSLNQSHLLSLVHLKKLDISHNKIKELQDGLFSSGNSIEIIDASYNKIKNVNGLEGKFPELQQLLLHNNELESISAVHRSTMPKLEILKVGHNKIAGLGNQRYKFFQKLHTLEMNNNKISSISYSYLVKVPKLRKMVLSHNEIESLPLACFVNNKELAELYLDHNKMNVLNNLWLLSVTKINLSNNMIETIGKNAFREKIKIIDLSNNQIRNIKRGFFARLQNLTDLNVHNNKIEQISRFAFESMRSLVNLNMSHNSLVIGMEEFDMAFRPLTSLKTLDLRSNKIKLVPSFAFAGLSRLNTLLLDGNEIRFIERDAFANLKNIAVLHINTSNLFCDCSIGWFADWLSEKKLADSVFGKCASPKYLKGQDMGLILKSELTCVMHDKGHSIRPNIVVHPVSKYSPIHGNVSMTCFATASVESPLKISWYHDGKLIEKKKMFLSKQQQVRTHLYKRASVLVLDEIRYEDKGEYRCTVSNEYGSGRSLPSSMTVVIPPTISKRPPPLITLNAGEDVSIPCSADGIPLPTLSFSKVKGDETAWTEAFNKGRVRYDQEAMIIRSLKVEDSGQYACFGRSQAGEANATVTIVVNGKPTFIRPMRSQSVPVGTTAVLDCIVSGNPPPKITWYKDNVALNASDSVELKKQMLIIDNFQEEHGGSYQCHAANIFGSASQSARLTISYYISDEPDVNTAVIVMTVVIVFTVTSFIWFLLLCYCRHLRKRICKPERSLFQTAPTFEDDGIIPELPNNYVLRCNGKVISPPPQQPPQPSTPLPPTEKKPKLKKYSKGSKRKGSENDIIEDPTTVLLMKDALRFLREQQTLDVEDKEREPFYEPTSDSEDPLDDDQHDSGVLVHYRSGSSLCGGQNSTPSPILNTRGRPFVTIELKNSNHHRDRRKLPNAHPHPHPHPTHTRHKHSNSIDSSTLCTNNNSGLEKLTRKRLSSTQSSGREECQNYFTSSSGIESGVSSSAETISLHESTKPPDVIEVI